MSLLNVTAASPVVAMCCEQLAGHDVWVLELEGGEKLRARSVLIATGAEYRRLDAECRECFEGAGVYYAAPTVDPQLYERSTVVVVGAETRPDRRSCTLPSALRKY